MAYSIEIIHDATDDLKSIYRYIKKHDSSENAKYVFEQIKRTISTLAGQPNRGNTSHAKPPKSELVSLSLQMLDHVIIRIGSFWRWLSQPRPRITKQHKGDRPQ